MKLKLERIIGAWQSLKPCNLSFPLSICNLFPLENYTPIYVISYIQCLFGYCLLLKTRDVHGLGWVRFSGFFDSIHHGGLKKIQPNPTHHVNPTQLTWVGLNPWVGQIFIIIIIIIIKLSKKNININILKKPKD